MSNGLFTMGKIFISYSHDSKEHAKRVLSFSNQLVKDGIDCILDQYIETPPEGWPRWMGQNINDSTFVLMICTENYYNRVMGKEETGKGLGVKWEGKLIYNHIYSNDTKNTKFIPVLFDPQHAIHIPEALKDTTYHTVTSRDGYDNLYRRITTQPKTLKPEKGTIKELPQEEAPSFFESPWDIPDSGLNEGGFKAAALGWTGFRLRVVGRLQEAVRPMETGLNYCYKLRRSANFPSVPK